MPHHAADRRIERTRSLLHDALASLVHEKPYDDIAVTEILARADVARSTFYAHYRDKDELLEHGIRELLRADLPAPSARWANPADRLLRFSLPFLEHVERYRDEGRFVPHARGVAPIHDRLRRVLERVLADELRAERHFSSRGEQPISAELLARHVAATFVVVLEWWLEHPELSARDVDAKFCALVAAALSAVGQRG
jgi:AcrR family transcriptional regulator